MPDSLSKYLAMIYMGADTSKYVEFFFVKSAVSPQLPAMVIRTADC